MTSTGGGTPAQPLAQPLGFLLGENTAATLNKQLGLNTVGELLDYFPRKYIQRGELTAIDSLQVDEQVTVVASVVSATKRHMRSRKGFIVDIVVTDESELSGANLLGTPARLSMAFFNGWDAHKRLTPGTLAMFHGKTALYRNQLTLNNPDFTVLDDEHTGPTDADLAPIPIYKATAKLPTWKIRTCVDIVIDAVNWNAIPDPLPQSFLDRLGQDLPDVATAYLDIHRPAQVEDAHAAKQRFAAQEALILQTVLARRRASQTEHSTATAFPVLDDGLRAGLDARLPFELTSAQQAAGEQIGEELDSTRPMSRLLQGEVGSGKTLVALRAMLQVADHRAQAALVAPTEVLAAQHFNSITQHMGELASAGQLTTYQGPATEVVLLTGSMSSKEKQSALLKIATGEAGIVIGTHALFSDNVTFAELGLVVIDEQHRFGVDQREALRHANPGTHMLVMTATPIPRSVAMTVFGDLDVTVLEGVPSGRQPVTTHLVRMAHGPHLIGRVWEIIAEQIAAGHQAFIVCPKIDPSSAPGTDGAQHTETTGIASPEFAANVEDMAQLLPSIPVLADARIGMLHGRMHPEDQAEVMNAFAAGELDIIVSTTIVEVGVDVPNATIMAILDAEYFGLSTLHQLRGRVGRGTAQATCFLATRLPDHHPSLDRLDVVAGTHDGFQIASADLEYRGEGDILGAAQHGYASRLKVLKVIRHAELIGQAAEWIATVLDTDPELDSAPELLAAVQDWETQHHTSSDYLEKN